jgi:hypothetical protein
MKAACWWSRCVSTRNLQRTRIPRALRAALAATRLRSPSSARPVMSAGAQSGIADAVTRQRHEQANGGASIHQGSTAVAHKHLVNLSASSTLLPVLCGSTQSGERQHTGGRCRSMEGRTLHGLEMGGRGPIDRLRALPCAPVG